MTRSASTDGRATFGPELYRERRAALRASLGASLRDGMVIFPGACNAPANSAANSYPFVQDSCFRYFFGLNEPDLVGVIDLESGSDTLFGSEPSLDDTIWRGQMPSLEERASRAGVQTQKPIGEAAAFFSKLSRSGGKAHYAPTYRAETTIQLSRWLEQTPASIIAGASTELVRAVIALREIKAPCEIAEMERAVAIAAQIHRLAMTSSLPGVYERDVVGAMEQIMRTEGVSPAYAPIFSRRGEVLHNLSYSGRLQAGDLVVNDTGVASPHGYASDITRTLPIGGRFSDRQRELYGLVLSSQTDAIAAMGPGVPFLDVHKRAAKTLTEGLVAMGVLKGDPSELVEDGVHAVVFPVGLGHQIGLDVHDMEPLGEDLVGYGDEVTRSSQFGLSHLRMARPLKPGMVMTVEPGLYFIPALIERWSSEGRFSGAILYDRLRDFIGVGGIRIEDDVLVTDEGVTVLGPTIPSTIDQVEVAMGLKSRL